MNDYKELRDALAMCGGPRNWNRKVLAEFQSSVRPDVVIALLADLDAARADAARLDWLTLNIMEHGSIHLHDGDHPSGYGLGLRPGSLARTLRAAIDAAIKGDK